MDFIDNEDASRRTQSEIPWTGLHHHHYPDQHQVKHTVIYHDHPDQRNRGLGFHDHGVSYYYPCVREDCIFKQLEEHHNS